MSNRDEFDFDDDLFGDSGGGDDDQMSFGDDDLGDEDFEDMKDFDDLDTVDEGFLTEDEGSETPTGGTSRTFVILAGLMILMFVAGLVAVIILASSSDELTPQQVQATNDSATIIAANSTLQADSFLTATAAVEIPLTQTQEAVLTGTAQSIIDQTGTAEAEQAAIQATQTAQQSFIDQTNTAIASVLITPTLSDLELTGTAASGVAQVFTEVPLVTQPPLGISDVEATATALFLIFNTTPTQEIATEIGGGPIPSSDGGAGTGELPQTGGLDNLGDIGMFALATVALLGVIFGARRLRAVNNLS